METVDNNEKLLELYFASLTPNESKAYFIAKEHLGNVFNIFKTISFIQWKIKHEGK
jgi:hypothetical protein